MGTIGHVDHGKTSLTAAITKVSKVCLQIFRHATELRCCLGHFTTSDTLLPLCSNLVVYINLQTLFDKGMRNTHYVPYDKIDNAPDEKKVRNQARSLDAK